MLGDTITITIDSVAKILSKINQDSYGAEYLLRSSTDEYRLKIRHTKVKSSGGVVYDRHNVQLIQTVFATSTAPAYTRESTVIHQNLYSDDAATVAKQGVGLEAYLNLANLTKVINWES